MRRWSESGDSPAGTGTQTSRLPPAASTKSSSIGVNFELIDADASEGKFKDLAWLSEDGSRRRYVIYWSVIICLVDVNKRRVVKAVKAVKAELGS